MSTDTPTATLTEIEEIPELVAGDRLTRAEFERRYEAMPHVKKAELIEGIVYLPTHLGRLIYASSRFNLVGLLGFYVAHTPGAEGGAHSTVRLDLDNEPQPDALLRILPEHRGQTVLVDGYVKGAPELVADVASSSASYDLHDKLNAYRRNGVCEYIVWRVRDRAIDWFVLNEGRYEELPPDSDGIVKSRVFPGLWLDPAALIGEEFKRAFDVLQAGIDSEEHAAFVEKLAKNRKS